ncbi:hypothetical protein [Brucella intermedia]|uniref:hypothetical protein n=1 Tax=Brucella intermedia TaxID=94625 RepID=UPI001FFFA242|nr:hypothetical protein [Brucella intermedia]
MMFSRLKQFRRIANRYDQLAESFINMVPIATATYWIKFLTLPKQVAELVIWPSQSTIMN